MTADQPVKFRPAQPSEPPERVPKRERQPRSDTGKPRARRGANLERRIGAALVQTNIVLQQIPAVRADALDTAELTLLAKGISDECNRHPIFRKYVETALNVSGSGGLIVTVAIIAARRAARHNVIPSGVLPIPNAALDTMLGQLAVMTARSDSEIMRAAQQQPPAMMPEQDDHHVAGMAS